MFHMQQRIYSKRCPAKTQPNPHWRETIRVFSLQETFCAKPSLALPQTNPHRWETLRVFNLQKIFHSTYDPEAALEGSFWRETVFVLILQQIISRQGRGKKTHADSYSWVAYYSFKSVNGASDTCSSLFPGAEILVIFYLLCNIWGKRDSQKHKKNCVLIVQKIIWWS
jgi:hypothetical protein